MKHMNDQEEEKKSWEEKAAGLVIRPFWIRPFWSAEQFCAFLRNVYLTVCSLLRKTCFSEVTQKPNKYLVNYYTDSQPSIHNLSYHPSSKYAWSHDWFAHIFIFSQFIWESNLEPSARVLGDTNLFLQAGQLWLLISLRPLPSPSLRGKVLWVELGASPGESSRRTLLVSASVTCSLPGQLCQDVALQARFAFQMPGPFASL